VLFGYPRGVAKFHRSVAVMILASAPLLAAAQGDYDPENDDWNGLATFVTQARASGLEIAIENELDFGRIDRNTSLIIVYPSVPLDRPALVAHLRAGGRVLVADDFGESSAFLERLGVRRDESSVVGGLHFRGEPDLPIAAPVADDHVLTLGVRRLLTNHPATLVSDLPPVFTVGEPERTLVAVGAIGDGRLVILADPSVLINNMLEVRGNLQFARNLLGYLAGEERRPLVMVSGRFAQRAGAGAMASSAGEARRELNITLARLSDWLAALAGRDLSSPLALALATVGAFILLAVVIAQLKPRPRLYSGRWLSPLAEERSAGFVGTIEYFRHPRASHVYPLMILKRVLEERLLDGLGLAEPARLHTVMSAYAKVEPNARNRKELQALLVRLATMASSTVAGESSQRISARELRRTFEKARRLLKPVGRDIEVP
jgi:hypothetical protein